MQRLGPNVLQRIAARRRRRMNPGWAVALALLALLAGLSVWAVNRFLGRRSRKPRAAALAAARSDTAPAAVPWKDLRYPTGQDLLRRSANPPVFQSTGSGRPESALFGSTRTVERGKRVMSSFHEGVDIAALKRGRDGRPLDPVYAVADGRVAYLNSVAGNSNYGKYVVIAHDDPLGQVYSLYAHLAEVQRLRIGALVRAGAHVGRMGNTSSSGIPLERGHLHFELALLLNSRFAEWSRAQKLVPDHGNFNGRNLLGVDPLAFYRRRQQDPKIRFADFIAALPAAFEVIVRAGGKPDYFRRYPSLWAGPPPDSGIIVLACTENGLPLWGRGAGDDECRAMGSHANLVRNVDEAALGRNGSHLVRNAGGEWALTAGGLRWVEILTYLGATRGAGMPARAAQGGAAQRKKGSKRPAGR